MLIALCIAYVLAVAANLYDNISTVRGIAAGLAVEGNTYIDFLFGNKPKLWQLLVVEQGIIAVLFVAGFFTRSNPASAAFLAGLAIAAIKHLQGGLAWRKLTHRP